LHISFAFGFAMASLREKSLSPFSLVVFGGVVHKVVLQGHEGVRLADVSDLSGFGKPHEPVPGPSFPVAGGAKAGDMVLGQEPAHHFVQRPCVVDLELGGIFLFLFPLHISADAGGRGAADLGYAQADDLGAGLFDSLVETMMPV
jgi:hypothetical protein